MSTTRKKVTFQLHAANNHSDIIYNLSTDNYEAFTLLLSDANVNDIIDTKNGYTALHYAIMFNKEKFITFLLEKGALPDIKTYENQDAFDLSLKYQNKTAFLHEIDKKNKANSELQRIITMNERDIKNLEINNKYLDDMFNEVTLKNSLLKTTIENLNDENNTLKMSNQTLKRKYDKLEKSYDGLLTKFKK
jgi:ankyrin repeat protein